MEQEQPDYLSYLLRLWRASDDKGPTWRAGLKSSHTGEEVGFGSLDDLFDYLRREAGLETGRGEQGRGDRGSSSGSDSPSFSERRCT